MSTATLPPPPLPVMPPAAPPPTAIGPTAADLIALIERLGGIPADRVRMWPLPGTATKADAVHSEPWYGATCELVDGTLVEKAMGSHESAIAYAVGMMLGRYNEGRNLGLIAGADGMFTVVPDQMRMPDVSFTLWTRVPTTYPDDAAPDVSPDLAVDVLSPRNTVREIERKRREYFAGGTRLVWVFDPPTRTVTVYVPGRADPVAVLSDADTLDGGDVLPGFSMPVRRAFDRALRPSPDAAGRQPPPAP